MAKAKVEPIWSTCGSCERSTKHDILCDVQKRGDDDYNFWMQHAVVECRGCSTRSFRYHFKDIENAFPVSDDEWDVPEEIEHYPRADDKSLEIDGIELVPDVVKKIYNSFQSLFFGLRNILIVYQRD